VPEQKRIQFLVVKTIFFMTYHNRILLLVQFTKSGGEKQGKEEGQIVLLQAIRGTKQWIPPEAEDNG